MDTNKIISLIEKGMQLGISRIIEIDNSQYAYTYAIQKLNGKYIVYTDKYNLDEYYSNELETTEVVRLYDTISEVISDFHNQYGITFEDISVSKGQKFFNADLFIQTWFF